ncbi:HAMP domain-containing histidine kinase [Anaerobacillus sp. CMMVII]|uniref:sensor histidine kinase n=1 Tax=Anaerobacillus sp. CMMVII TaxID=2755588 RepID=UPI0021B789FD|nr:HAMP domain-containing sensor histidine kinase [Anaerobacillus sp. CMMVII]MCT8137210.1 HAMP domain-containing histidine kinase [Anaerobacillus sp. CMMVII]
MVSSLIISSIMLLTILFLLLPYYHQQSKLKKVILLMVAPIFFSGITIIFNISVMTDILENFGLFFMFGLVEAISVGLIVFIIEFIRESTIIKEEYFESDKLRVVSELAASVSHEVKNPLTVTRGFIQLLHDPKLDANKKAEFLQLSLQELDRAQEIITDYLNLAKPSSIVEGQTHNLNLEIEYIAKVMKPLALLQGVEIVTIAKNECFISGDCQKLRQCLINIVKNGIEAMVNGGVLTIQLFLTTDEIVISIHDTGVGMSKKQIESLGTAFQTTKEHGTGLGLMVVNNIVRIMGGSIEIESIEGKGTIFKLFFPQARQHKDKK